jgi:hypothetical protein
MTFPPGNDRDYGVTPLIYSGGADAALVPPITDPAGTTPSYGGYYAASDISSTTSWVSSLVRPAAGSILDSGSAPSLRTITSGTLGPGAAFDAQAIRDNITNFDLMKK